MPSPPSLSRASGLGPTRGKPLRYNGEPYRGVNVLMQVAEIGAAFLRCDLGLTPEPREDHAGYLYTFAARWPKRSRPPWVGRWRWMRFSIDGGQAEFGGLAKAPSRRRNPCPFMIDFLQSRLAADKLALNAAARRLPLPIGSRRGW